MERSGGRSDLAIAAGLFLLAAVARILFLHGTVDRDLPFSIFYYGDSRVYREFALALIRGQAYDQGIPFHPPGFAFVLSWVIRLVGERPTALRGVLALASALTVPLTYLLGRRLWTRSVALTAALLATFSFGLLVTAVSANTETIYVPMLVGQALLLVLLGDALEEKRSGRARVLLAASGLLLGFGALTRAEHLAMLVALPLALWLGWRQLGLLRVLRLGAVQALIAAFVIVPWTLHNYTALRHFNASTPGLAGPLPTFVLVSGYGPLNFALANHEGADGTFRPEALVSRMGGGRLDFRDPRQLETYRDGYRIGLRSLRADPRRAARLWLRKLDLAADAFALGFGASDLPGGLRGTRRPVDIFVPARKIAKPLALALAALGLWFSRRHWRRASVVLLVGLQLAAVTMAFYGYARFFVHFAPFAFLLEAAALVALVERLSGPRARTALAGAGVLIAALLSLELARNAASPRNFRASGSTDPQTGKILQDARVEIEPLE